MYLGRVQGVQTPALFGTVQIVPLSSQTHLEETLWKISLKYERIYQNDALREFFEVFNATLGKLITNVESESAVQKNAELIFDKLYLNRKLEFRVLFSFFHSTCYVIFGSFTFFISTFLDNLKTISLLYLLIQNILWIGK